MQVNEEQATPKGLTCEFQGQTYFFCSPDCKQPFEQNPQRYAGRGTAQC
jgi:YHS domain-containing protein